MYLTSQKCCIKCIVKINIKTKNVSSVKYFKLKILLNKCNVCIIEDVKYKQLYFN